MFIPRPIPDDLKHIPALFADYAAKFGKDCKMIYGEWSADTPEGFSIQLVFLLHVYLDDLHCAHYVLESAVRNNYRFVESIIIKSCLAIDKRNDTRR